MDVPTPIKEDELSLIKKYPIETVLGLLIIAVISLTWYVAGLEKDFRTFVINQGEQAVSAVRENTAVLLEVRKAMDKK